VRVLALLLVGAALSLALPAGAGASGISVFIGSPTIPVTIEGTVANLFIDGSGTCAWEAVPDEYNSATACAGFDAAEAACATAGTGGTIMVTGTYGSTTVVGTAADSPDKTDCVFKPVTGESVTLSGGWVWDTVDDVALEDFNYSGGCNDSLAIDNTERFTVRRSQFHGPGGSNQGAIVLAASNINDADTIGVRDADDTLIEDPWIDCEGTGSNITGNGIIMEGQEIGDLTIRGALIERPHEDHIHFDVRMSAEASGDIIVEDSVLRDARAALGSHSDAIQFLKAPNVTVRRSVLDSVQHGFITTNTTESGPSIDRENNYVSGNGNGSMVNDGSPCQAGIFRNNTFRNDNAGALWDKACIGDVNGNVIMDTADYSSSSEDGDYNVFRDTGGWTLGANSVAGQTLAAVFNGSGGNTAVANVYPPRVIAVWPAQASAGSRTIRDPRLTCSTSPAVGRAHPTNVPTLDLLGRTRSTPDGGAYECLAGDA